MADSVELVVELKDHVSRNAKSAGAALDKLARRARHADGRFKKLHETAEGRAKMQVAMDKKTMASQYRVARASALAARKQTRANQASTQELINNVGMATKAAFGLMAISTGVAAFLGKQLYDTAKNASMLANAFDRLTDGKGPETMERVTKLAANLGLEVAATAHNFADLLKLQFSPAQAEEWIKFGADMQAIGGTAESVHGILRAVGQIKGKGKLMAEELTGQLAEHGVSTSLVKDAVARMMGIDRSTVDAAIRAGKVNAEVGIAAIQEAINKKLHQKQAGDTAADFIKNTFTGDQKKLEGSLERIGLGLGLMFSRGFEGQLRQANSMKKFGITDSFATDAGSDNFLEKLANDPLIERLGGFVEGLGTAFAELLPLILEVARSFVEGFSDGFGIDDTAKDTRTLAVILRDDFAPAAKSVGVVLGYLINMGLAMTTTIAVFSAAVVNGIALIVGAVMSVPQILSDLGGALYNIGRQAITGFVNGIKDTWSSLKESATAFASDILGKTDKELIIKSPSKAFAWRGEMAAKGFQVGLDKTTPVLPGASAMVGSDAMKGGGGSSFGNFSFAITVNGGGDAEETGRAVFAEFESNMTRFLGGMVQQAGA